MASRVLWKGAISFGLVHIPVALHPATIDNSLDFDWLDKRSMEPVGYKRINKNTGKEVTKENIVKGIAYEEGQYVVLSDDEIAAAYPRTTQTIEIESFVGDTEIPFVFLERPYYIAPINKGHKVYALLRDTLVASKRVGVARVVIQTKQHLAALVPSGQGLVLNLLRWGADVRTQEDLDLPPKGADAGFNDRELKMAKQLVEDMAGEWAPDQFTDSFKEKILALVDEKVKHGETETVSAREDAPDAERRQGAQIVDLTELLQRSLRKGGAAAKKPATVPAKTKTASTKKAAAKSTAKAAENPDKSEKADKPEKTKPAPLRRAA
jgi:DNA end-binding protein Ku